jgi:putative oxidoreductase
MNDHRMTLKNFLFPAYLDESRTYSTLVLIIRILFGFLFLSHGYAKLMQHASMADLFADPFGLGSTLSFWMVVFAEVVCSFALIFGILQRVVLIPMTITMAVAFFVVHGGDAFAARELSFIYFIVFIILFITGPGEFSFDSIIGKHLIDKEDVAA